MLVAKIIERAASRQIKGKRGYNSMRKSHNLNVYTIRDKR